MPAWFHAFMQHTNDFDYPGSDYPKVKNVHGLSDSGLVAVTACVLDVEAAYTGRDLGAVSCLGTCGVGGDSAHRHSEDNSVTAPALEAPLSGTRCKNVSEIGLRRAGEPKASQPG
jgi:hypothetical protein